MKVAIVHDWLVNYGGAESFVELLLRMYPDADIYTLVYDRRRMGSHFADNKIYTSRLQRVPFATRLYRKLLKFMPKAFESFDFAGYDLVISSSSSCAKGVITPPDVPHIAYIHTPMRYAWDMYFEYRRRSGFLTRFFMDRWMPEIRTWDFISGQRPDLLVANSKYVARRIKKFWGRDASVIYSMWRLERYAPAKNPALDYYAAFSRFVPYKRIDVAIGACKKLNKKLVVIGSGPEEKRLKKLAAGGNITFTGRVENEELVRLLQNSRALIFCAEEDFGLVPLEAQACGRPVIAFGKGGALETVVDGKTGVFFGEQTADSCAEGIQKFERLDAAGAFKSEEIARHAAQFSEDRFVREFGAAVKRCIETIGKNKSSTN